MTRFKFRAWDLKGKCMLDWFCIRQTAFNRSDGKGEYGLMYKVFTATDDQFIIQQFTGKTDRNEKELYEGDIITNNPLNKNLETDMWYEIYWDGRWRGRLVCHHSVCGGSEIDDISKIDLRFFERIGNIYENDYLINANKLTYSAR